MTNGHPGGDWLDAAASLLGGRHPDIDAVLDGIYQQPQWDRHLFYPVPRGIFDRLARFRRRPWNNIGHRKGSPPGGNHTKAAERAVLEWAAGLLLKLDGDDWWGNLTTGGTGGNRAGLLAGRDSFPRNPHGLTTAVCYYAESDHYSIPHLLHELCIPSVLVHAQSDGTMDYDHLAEVLQPGQPAIVVCTIGTTTTEAVTDARRVLQVLDAAGAHQRYLHGDGALSAIPMALSDLLPADSFDSISVSGSKFLGVLEPTGIVVGRHYTQRREQHIAYINTVADSPVGSIDGVPALAMWLVIATEGNSGLRKLADDARRLAAYLTARLTRIGWPAWRFEHAFTVVFPEPPPTVLQEWPVYRDSDGQCHLICMPGVTRAHVDAFVDALQAALTGGAIIPRPRHLNDQAVLPAPTAPAPAGRPVGAAPGGPGSS